MQGGQTTKHLLASMVKQVSRGRITGRKMQFQSLMKVVFE
jgi:hypothetical protein